MKKRPLLVLLLLSLCLSLLLNVWLLIGPSELQKATSKALLDASEQCLYEVRDHKRSYWNASNCIALGALAQQYINAGGGRQGAPIETEIDFQRARVQAWMALALSESKNPELLRIW